MKFERRLDCEAVQFLILSEDWGKLAFLHADRNVSFHAPYGVHHTLRIPKFGRDMVYQPFTCDLYCCGSAPELYRINLDQGRFLAPLESVSPEVGVCLAYCSFLDIPYSHLAISPHANEPFLLFDFCCLLFIQCVIPIPFVVCPLGQHHGNQPDASFTSGRRHRWYCGILRLPCAEECVHPGPSAVPFGRGGHGDLSIEI